MLHGRIRSVQAIDCPLRVLKVRVSIFFIHGYLPRTALSPTWKKPGRPSEGALRRSFKYDLDREKL
jgi:hypothetical protein